MKDSKLILSFIFPSKTSRHLSKIFAQMVEAVFTTSSWVLAPVTKSYFTLALSVLSHMAKDLADKTTKPSRRSLPAKSSPWPLDSQLRRGKDHVCLVQILKRLHSPNLCDDLSKSLMLGNFLSFSTTVSPTSNSRIRKQLQNFL